MGPTCLRMRSAMALTIQMRATIEVRSAIVPWLLKYLRTFSKWWKSVCSRRRATANSNCCSLETPYFCRSCVTAVWICMRLIISVGSFDVELRKRLETTTVYRGVGDAVDLHVLPLVWWRNWDCLGLGGDRSATTLRAIIKACKEDPFVKGVVAGASGWPEVLTRQGETAPFAKNLKISSAPKIRKRWRRRCRTCKP